MAIVRVSLGLPPDQTGGKGFDLAEMSATAHRQIISLGSADQATGAIAEVVTAAPATGTAGIVAYVLLPGAPAQEGTDATGVNPPTGATGIRGWLSGIYQAITGTLAKESGGNLATVATNTGKIPALGQTAKNASVPVTVATDQPSIPMNQQIGTPLFPAGAASLTTNVDGQYTFAQTVHHVVVQNNTTTATGVAFDTTATAGSYQVPANSERSFDLSCTVLHLFSAAASAVNGTAAGNIVVMGAV